MEPTLIKLRPPRGIDELWVLDHFARDGQKTRLAEAFTDAKYPYYHPAVGSRLARHMVESVKACAPESAALRHVERVMAIPSSKGLSRLLAIELDGSLGLPRPERSDLSWHRVVPPVKNVPVVERRRHLEGAMSATPMLADAVLLVDDAVQSRATLLEASRAVRHAGARLIVAIALVAVDGHG